MSSGHDLKAHLFICTNKKENGESCAARGSIELREAVKKACQDESHGWHGKIRVNTAGCLGRCKEGITAVMYPEGKWLTGLTKDDSAVVIDLIRKTLD